MKKIKILFIICFVALAIVLSVRFQSKQMKIECPQEVKAATGIALPFHTLPPLKAILEISREGSVIQTREIGAQLVPKHANRSNSPRLIQLSQIELNDISPGSYHLKVTLKHSGNDLTLATLDLDSTIQPGSAIDFGQASWNYEVDESPVPDHFNNITEIMNGRFEAVGGNEVPNQWVSEATDARNSSSYPASATLLRPYAISVSSPGPGGKIRVVGDPFSVQSGVNVIATLYASNGNQKSKVNAYSRLDGSFELPPLFDAVAGDNVRVSVSSRTGIGSPSSLSIPTGTGREVALVVRDSQNCQ